MCNFLGTLANVRECPRMPANVRDCPLRMGADSDPSSSRVVVRLYGFPEALYWLKGHPRPAFLLFLAPSGNDIRNDIQERHPECHPRYAIPECHPTSSPFLLERRSIRVVQWIMAFSQGRSMDVSWMFRGRSMDVPWMFHGRHITSSSS